MVLDNRKLALEAARAATIAVHSAGGLTRSCECVTALRLIRSAEGLLRSAIMMIQAPRPDNPVPPAAATVAPGARVGPEKPRPKRKRKKKGGMNLTKHDGADQVANKDVCMAQEDGDPNSAAAAAQYGDSALVPVRTPKPQLDDVIPDVPAHLDNEPVGIFLQVLLKLIKSWYRGVPDMLVVVQKMKELQDLAVVMGGHFS